MELFKPIKAFLAANYVAHEERADFYTYFVERGITLLSSSGVFAMIVSNKFAVAKYGRPLRRFLSERATIHSIADFAGMPVFKRATVRTVVLTASCRHAGPASFAYYVPVPSLTTFRDISAGALSVANAAKKSRVRIARGQIAEAPWQLTDSAIAALIARLEQSHQSLAELNLSPLFGVKTGCNEAFIIDDAERSRLLRADRRSNAAIKAILFGRDIRRYETRQANRFVIYLHPEKDIRHYSAIANRLSQYRSQLQSRATKQAWFELQQPAVAMLTMLSRPKIVYPIIAPEPRFTLDAKAFLINDKAFALPTASPHILAFLNSRIGRFFFSAVCARLEGRGECYYEFRAQFVERFPVPELKPSSKSDFDKHNKIARLVQDQLDLRERLAVARTEYDQSSLLRQIHGADRQIDQLVYELYGLTDKEIALVEEATRSE